MYDKRFNCNETETYLNIYYVVQPVDSNATAVLAHLVHRAELLPVPTILPAPAEGLPGSALNLTPVTR